MKRILFAILCAASVGSASAAITLQEAKANTCTSAVTCSVTLTNPVSAGDVLVAAVYAAPGGGASAGPSTETDTGSDTAQNPIAWKWITSDWGTGVWIFVVGTGGSSFSVTINFASATSYRIHLLRYSGVNGTTPVDASAAVANGTSVSPAATAIASTVANDQQVAFLVSSSTASISSWGNSLVQELYSTGSIAIGGTADAPIASVGTVNASATLGASSPWGMSQLLLKPASGGASCTHQGQTSGGALAVPNGTSGSYLLKNGTFGIPDCSTVSYKQPTVGNFGVN